MKSSKTFKQGDLVRYPGLPYLLKFDSYDCDFLLSSCLIVGTNRSCTVFARHLELDKNAIVIDILKDL